MRDQCRHGVPISTRCFECQMEATPRAAHEPETGHWYAAEDIDALVRELDVWLNGEEGAAKQAKLCDIVAQITRRTQPPGHGQLAADADQLKSLLREWLANRMGGVGPSELYQLAKRTQEVTGLTKGGE